MTNRLRSKPSLVRDDGPVHVPIRGILAAVEADE
jgi:hypothetical protein